MAPKIAVAMRRAEALPRTLPPFLPQPAPPLRTDG